jgi:hypothetical protein
MLVWIFLSFCCTVRTSATAEAPGSNLDILKKYPPLGVKGEVPSGGHGVGATYTTGSSSTAPRCLLPVSLLGGRCCLRLTVNRDPPTKRWRKESVNDWRLHHTHKYINVNTNTSGRGCRAHKSKRHTTGWVKMAQSPWHLANHTKVKAVGERQGVRRQGHPLSCVCVTSVWFRLEGVFANGGKVCWWRLACGGWHAH